MIKSNIVEEHNGNESQANEECAVAKISTIPEKKEENNKD